MCKIDFSHDKYLFKCFKTFHGSNNIVVPKNLILEENILTFISTTGELGAIFAVMLKIPTKN